MFTERHHIPFPVFVFLGKTNSLLLVFSHLLSFLSLTHPPSPVLHLLLHEYTFLTEPYTVFLAHSCILVLNLPICSRTVSLKLSCNRISRDTSPPYVPIAIRVPLLPPAASSALGSFPPLLPPARTSCTSFPHRLKTHTARSWCQHSVLCSPTHTAGTSHTALLLDFKRSKLPQKTPLILCLLGLLPLLVGSSEHHWVSGFQPGIFYGSVSSDRRTEPPLGPQILDLCPTQKYTALN